MGQAPGAGGVCFFAVFVAGRWAVCKRIYIAPGCRGCGAAHDLLNVPRLMQGSADQGVEQRHQQKHDVEREGGDGAAQHEGCESYSTTGGAAGDAPALQFRTLSFV